MGLLDLFLGGGRNNRHSRMSDEYTAALREMRKQKSKLYRNVRTVLILASVLTLSLLVLGFIVPDLRHAWLFKLVFVMFALCVCGAMTLPWVTEFERDRKKLSKGEEVASWRKWVVFVAWGLIGLSALLWIISVFVIGDRVEALIDYLSSNSNSEFDFGKTFTMLRLSSIFMLQVAVGSVITISTMRFGKNYLLLRVIMYVTILYLDFWLSWFIGAVTIQGLENGFAPISVTFLWVVAVLMFIALCVASSIFGAQARRKALELFMKGDMETLTSGDVDFVEEDVQEKSESNEKVKVTKSKTEEKDPEQQLSKIKNMLDKGIITEEEYQQKRKDIIDKM